MGKRHDKRWTSASELAQMGVCEHMIVLKRTHGALKTPEQEEASARGDAAHAAFFEEGLRHRPESDVSKPWCFIATFAFGADAPETALLRRFRDTCLRPSRIGRACIVAYYAGSPTVCRVLGSVKGARRAARIVLRPVLWIAAAMLYRAGCREAGGVR